MCSVMSAIAALAALAGAARGQVFQARLAADINHAAVTNQGSSPGGFIGDNAAAPLGAGTVFNAYDREHGKELWYTDGTEGGTHLIKDLQGGSRSSNPRYMAALNGKVVFVATTDEAGTELWSTDGTAEGTVMIKDLSPGAGSIVPQYCERAGPLVFFVTATNLQLWRTDGTEAGTFPVTAEFANVTEIEAVGDKVFFPAVTSAEGSELWVSDGTVAGTHLVKDIVPGSASSSIMGMFAAGNRLVFFPSTPEYGYEPWVSDGTSAGTVLAKDIYPGPYSNFDPRAAIAGGKVYFSASSPTSGWELWVSDGTVGGTVLAADIAPGEDSSNPSSLAGCPTGVVFQAEVGGVRNAYFFGASGLSKLTNYGLFDNFYMFSSLNAGARVCFFSILPGETPNYSVWSTDGTTGGTALLRDHLRYVNLLSAPIGTGTMLNLDDGVVGQEPWITDGTAGGTALIKDINTGPGESAPHVYTQAGGKLIFSADDGVHGVEPWVVEGSGAVSLLKDLGATNSGSTVANAAAFGDRAVVFARTAAGAEPWISDGTSAGTVQIADVEPGAGGSYADSVTNALPGFIAASGVFYYADLGGSAGRRNELVATNGSAAGTYVLDVNTKPNSGALTGGINGAPLGRSLIFAADDGTHGGELWKTDGTPAGTVMLKEFIAGSTGGVSLTENRFITLGSTVLFGATDSVIGSELWKTDGTPGGTVLVKDIRPGSQGSQPNPIAVIGSKVILLATTAAEGRELWVTDGTSAGTVFLADTNPGSGSASLLDRPLVSGGKAFMTLTSSAAGRELWVSDGTPSGTHMVKDIRPGPIGALSAGKLLAAAGGRVFFVADDGDHGLEPWVSDGTDEGTRMIADIYAGLPGSSPSYGALLGSTMYFDAYRPGEGEELWAVNVCPADFDGSGFVDRDDYDAFTAAFIEGGDSADYDGSGFVDESDFAAFVHDFETGC